MQYYTDLVWTRMVKEAMGRQQKSMKGMDEILKIPGTAKKCRKILVEGEYCIPKWQIPGKLCITIFRFMKDKIGNAYIFG